MPHQFSTLTFTDDVAEVQREMGSRPANEKLTERGPQNDTFGPHEKAFITARDGFYLSTVGKTGWPYVQFRGGPTGFLRVLDDRTLAYADITGNRQYITTGNLRSNHRASLFLMDYPNQTRLKILGTVEVTPWSKAPDWKNDLLIPDRSRPERAVLIHLAAFDWNCPQNIPQRWTIEELHQTPLFDRIRSLEQEVKDLRAKLAKTS
ncbi:MAG TPA: pyridoxamine 5'-phosphate oxidase family protein [Edaphobacter sp.]|nr:pyridoxamine 5'-phosphate oxidase family protein [Edaphobacter sp.]